MKKDKLEFTTYGIVDGYKGGDESSPGSAYAAARDTVGNGYRLDNFRGRKRHFLWIHRELRRENSRRNLHHIRRTESFLDNNFTNKVS